MGDFGGLLDPLNIFGGGSGGAGGNMGIGGVGNVGREFTGKPSPESQEAALNASTASTEWLTNMSKGYYNQTAPMRNELIGNLTNFLQGNNDPTASPMYAPIKMTAERQYQTAREQAMEDMPMGGALYDSLANIAGQRAKSITDMISQVVQDEYNKAYSMGQGSQQVSAAGVGAGAQSSNQLLSALASQQQAGASGVGNAVGLISALAKILEVAVV